MELSSLSLPSRSRSHLQPRRCRCFRQLLRGHRFGGCLGREPPVLQRGSWFSPPRPLALGRRMILQGNLAAAGLRLLPLCGQRACWGIRRAPRGHTLTFSFSFGSPFSPQTALQTCPKMCDFLPRRLAEGYPSLRKKNVFERIRRTWGGPEERLSLPPPRRGCGSAV